jgi:hypothetical protein
MRYDGSGNELAYMCCFCGAPIDQSDKEAVQLIATNLWARDAAQAVYAHSNCASERMAKGQLSPDALLDAECGYSLEEIVWGEDEGRRYSVSPWACLGILISVAIAAYLILS